MLVPGLVTTIGSLPHANVDEAVRFVLDHHPGLPAAPQVPRRSPLEGMLAQVAHVLPGVTVAADGSLAVDPAALARLSGRTGALPLDPRAHGGLLAFLEACRAGGWTGPVKLQLVGPVTLGVGLVEAGVPAAIAFRSALEAVQVTVAALVATARSVLSGTPLMVWLDEPGLVRWPELPLDEDAVVGALAAVVATLGANIVTGVHCCGPTDWRLASRAGATVLSLPVDLEDRDVAATATALGGHLERGGWIAWGAVPTDRPVDSDDGPLLWARLVERWTALAGSGCDLGLLRRQALVTPTCGLAGLDVAAAGRVVELAAFIGRRVAGSTAGSS